MIALLILLQTTLAIAVSGPHTSPEYLSLHTALVEGSFARERLSVTLRTTQGEAGAAEALAQRRAQVAATSLDAALRHASVDGQPPRLIFGLTAVPPAALLVPLAHRDAVRTPADLRGKTVGVVGPGAPEEPLLAALLFRSGIRLDQVSQLAFGQRALVAALERGEVEAGLLGDPWASRLVDEGKATVLADFRRLGDAARWLGGHTVHAALFVRADTPLGETGIAPLVRALLDASQRLLSAPPDELAARLPARVVGLPDDFRGRLAGTRGVLLPRGWVSAEAFQLSVDLLRIRSPLPRSIRLPRRLGDLLSLDPLRQILDERGAR